MLVDAAFWIVVFIISLFVLTKGSEYLIDNAEKIGLAWGISPFIVGIVIIGIGTSLPELTAAIMAILRGVTEFVPANAVGSNIANILLVLGVTGVLTRNFFVQKNLIYLDLPLLAIATTAFILVTTDTVLLPNGEKETIISRGEAGFLVVSYLIYLAYSLKFEDGYTQKFKEMIARPSVNATNYLWLVAGFAGVIFGAKFLVDATVEISRIFSIGVGIISIFAVALGTSLPELFVSIQAARSGKPELAFGNILGSNLFNILFLVGLPGVFTPLIVDKITFTLGLPFLGAATLILVISGITNKIHLWDGAMFIMLYVLFIAKLFSLF